MEEKQNQINAMLNVYTVHPVWMQSIQCIVVYLSKTMNKFEKNMHVISSCGSFCCCFCYWRDPHMNNRIHRNSVRLACAATFLIKSHLNTGKTSSTVFGLLSHRLCNWVDTRECSLSHIFPLFCPSLHRCFHFCSDRFK